MATVNYVSQYYPITDGDPGGLTSGTLFHFKVSYHNGRIVDDYGGSFSYGSDNLPSGGTVTALDEYRDGSVNLTMSGMNIRATDLVRALQSPNGDDLVNLVFGGADTITGSVFGEAIEAGPGNDIVIALDGDDTVDGGDGNDDVNGNKGQDYVLGGAGADTVRGGQGNDTIFGGDGDDPHVNGNIGDDSVSGGNGNDTVYGGQGADILHGDAGADLLSGDLGNDTLYGDAGADRFTIARNGCFDWVGDFNPGEGDKIQLAAGTAFTVTSVSGQVVIDLGNGDELGLARIAAGTFSNSWIVFG